MKCKPVKEEKKYKMEALIHESLPSFEKKQRGQCHVLNLYLNYNVCQTELDSFKPVQILQLMTEHLLRQKPPSARRKATDKERITS